MFPQRNDDVLRISMGYSTLARAADVANEFRDDGWTVCGLIGCTKRGNGRIRMVAMALTESLTGAELALAGARALAREREPED